MGGRVQHKGVSKCFGSRGGSKKFHSTSDKKATAFWATLPVGFRPVGAQGRISNCMRQPRGTARQGTRSQATKFVVNPSVAAGIFASPQQEAHMDPPRPLFQLLTPCFGRTPGNAHENNPPMATHCRRLSQLKWTTTWTTLPPISRQMAPLGRCWTPLDAVISLAIWGGEKRSLMTVRVRQGKTHGLRIPTHLAGCAGLALWKEMSRLACCSDFQRSGMCNWSPRPWLSAWAFPASRSPPPAFPPGFHLGGATGGSSSIMHAFSSMLVHLPLVPAWLCLRCWRK